MTIPLFIAESIPIEMRNILKSLDKGMKVRTPDGEEGYIDFISDQYITVVTHEWDDPGTMNGKRQVKVLVFQHQWDDMEIEDEHFYNHKNYKGRIVEHPGNEDLPPDITKSGQSI
jgi:hypothetical protein